MSSDGKSKNDEGSLGATPRKYFLPKELENATPEMIWEWWQKRGQQESLLKNAIVSAKVQSRNLPQNSLIPTYRTAATVVQVQSNTASYRLLLLFRRI